MRLKARPLYGAPKPPPPPPPKPARAPVSTEPHYTISALAEIALDHCCQACGVSVANVRSGSRRPKVTRARRLATYAMRSVLRMSYPEIASVNTGRGYRARKAAAHSSAILQFRSAAEMIIGGDIAAAEVVASFRSQWQAKADTIRRTYDP